MGEENKRRSFRGLLVECLVTISILALLAGLALPSMSPSGLSKPALLLQAVSNARQIHIGVQGAALDYGNTHIGIGWPAESGIKTGHEYVQRLIKEGVFKPADLKIFATPGQTPATSLETITPEHIGFRIANISESDPPETIFLVTPNFLDNTPYPFIATRHWWEYFWPRRTPRPVGFVVFRKGGDGTFFTKLPSQVATNLIGLLPPREPKFLDP